MDQAAYNTVKRQLRRDACDSGWARVGRACRSAYAKTQLKRLTTCDDQKLELMTTLSVMVMNEDEEGHDLANKEINDRLSRWFTTKTRGRADETQQWRKRSSKAAVERRAAEYGAAARVRVL